MIATPSRIRDVRAATYPSATIGSSTLWYTGSMPDPSGTSSRWKLHNDAYPASSARRANAVRYPGVAHAPATGAPNPIRMPNTLVKDFLAERPVVLVGRTRTVGR